MNSNRGVGSLLRGLMDLDTAPRLRGGPFSDYGSFADEDYLGIRNEELRFLESTRKNKIPGKNLSRAVGNLDKRNHTSVGSRTARTLSQIRNPTRSKALRGGQTGSSEESLMQRDIKAPQPPIMCRVCNIPCSSEVSYQQHIAGKKHKANVESHSSMNSKAPKLAKVKSSTPGVTIQSALQMLCETEDIVGMQYITEYKKVGTNHSCYFCELCDYKCDMDGMIHHVICRKHRLRYARAHLNSAYIRVTGYPSYEKMMLPAEADKFLAQVCARVVNADPARGMRSCQIKRYMDESEIVIDVEKFARIGKMHPSMHEDLVIVESIMDEAEAISNDFQSQPAGSSDASLMLKKHLPKSRASAPMKIQGRKRPKPANQTTNHAEITFLKEEEQNILDCLAANTTTIRLCGLTNAAARERDLLMNQLDDTRQVIQDLLSSAKHAMVETPELDATNGSTLRFSHLPPRKREEPLENDFSGEIPQKRMRDNKSEANNILSEPLAEIQKAVEPIIAETRRQIEKKIYEAIEHGNLPSVLNALKNNPNLHDSLLKWDKAQESPRGHNMAREEPGPSGVNSFHEAKPEFLEYADEPCSQRGADIAFRNRNIPQQPQHYDEEYPPDLMGLNCNIPRREQGGVPRRQGLLGKRPNHDRRNMFH